MAETLGSLVDKLCVTTMKLWFTQDKVHAAARDGVGLSKETVRDLNALNLQRNRLMTEIDALLDRAARDGKAEVDARVKITGE